MGGQISGKFILMHVLIWQSEVQTGYVDGASGLQASGWRKLTASKAFKDNTTWRRGTEQQDEPDPSECARQSRPPR